MSRTLVRDTVVPEPSFFFISTNNMAKTTSLPLITLLYSGCTERDPDSPSDGTTLAATPCVLLSNFGYSGQLVE